MSEADIDISQAEKDVNNEKLSALEKELQAYKEKEAQEAAAKEEAEKKAFEDRLAAIEAEKEEMKKSFEEKLEKVSLRESTKTAPKDDEGQGKLTKEEYLKNREKYDTMYLKATMPDIFEK